jgi:hypothetical protein
VPRAKKAASEAGEAEARIERKAESVFAGMQKRLEAAFAGMQKRLESEFEGMDRRFEEKSVAVARQIEKDRRKAMDADIQKYAKQMQAMMSEYTEKLKPPKKGFLETIFPAAEQHPHSSSGSDSEAAAKKKAPKKAGKAKAAHSGSDSESSAKKAPKKSSVVKEHHHHHNTRSSQKEAVAKTAGEVSAVIANMTGGEDDDLGGWGSDLSDKALDELCPVACTSAAVPCGVQHDKFGTHAAVHNIIVALRDIAPRDVTHETLDTIWMGLDNIDLYGPTRSDFEDVLVRQAALLRILTVMHDRVSDESMRTKVDADVVYARLNAGSGSIVESSDALL